MVLKLYKLDASPPVRAVYMVMEALGINDVEYIEVNLLERHQLKDEYIKINPQHTIPMLQDGNFFLWDSHAIAMYLVNKYGIDDSLYPSDPKTRAVVDQRLHFDSGILFPAIRTSVEPVFFWGEKVIRPEGLGKIKSAYTFMEKFLTTPWLAGEQLTLADICCVATISSMNEIMPIEEFMYPNLTKWLQKCSELEIYKKRNEPGLSIFANMLQGKI